jgi:hypothetical protein
MGFGTPNKALKLSVRPVTGHAYARPAPGRPAAYGRRWAAMRYGSA